MPFVHLAHRLRVFVLAAYLAAGTLGMLCHEHLHSHALSESCCHLHRHKGHEHAHAQAEPGRFSESATLVAAAEHDHGCIVCRVNGQPVVTAIAMNVDATAILRPDSLPCPVAAPLSLAIRLAQSRAPPLARI
jgi:hypothetical protein